MELLDLSVSYLFFMSVALFFALVIFFFYAGKKIGDEEREIMENKKGLEKERLK